MELAILIGLALAINKTVTVIKAASSKAWRTAVTQVLVWVVGFVGVLLASNAEVTEAMVVPGVVQPLGDLDAASILLLAWVLGSSGSFAFDVKRAVDQSDSAVEPHLNVRNG